jgi:hypothetical protein
MVGVSPWTSTLKINGTTSPSAVTNESVHEFTQRRVVWQHHVGCEAKLACSSRHSLSPKIWGQACDFDAELGVLLALRVTQVAHCASRNLLSCSCFIMDVCFFSKSSLRRYYFETQLYLFPCLGVLVAIGFKYLIQHMYNCTPPIIRCSKHHLDDSLWPY